MVQPGQKTLIELCAEVVALNYNSKQLTQGPIALNDHLLKKISYHAFPKTEDSARLFASVTHFADNVDEWSKGEEILKAGSIEDPVQSGFVVSCTVYEVVSDPISNDKEVAWDQPFYVSASFECQRLVETRCSSCKLCYCCHAVAAILYRIRQPDKVPVRSPVSTELSSLSRNQLQTLLQFVLSSEPSKLLKKSFTRAETLRLSKKPITSSEDCVSDPTIALTSNPTVHSMETASMFGEKLHLYLEQSLDCGNPCTHSFCYHGHDSPSTQTSCEKSCITKYMNQIFAALKSRDSLLEDLLLKTCGAIYQVLDGNTEGGRIVDSKTICLFYQDVQDILQALVFRCYQQNRLKHLRHHLIKYQLSKRQVNKLQRTEYMDRLPSLSQLFMGKKTSLMQYVDESTKDESGDQSFLFRDTLHLVDFLLKDGEPNNLKLKELMEQDITLFAAFLRSILLYGLDEKFIKLTTRFLPILIAHAQQFTTLSSIYICNSKIQQAKLLSVGQSSPEDCYTVVKRDQQSEYYKESYLQLSYLLLYFTNTMLVETKQVNFDCPCPETMNLAVICALEMANARLIFFSSMKWSAVDAFRKLERSICENMNDSSRQNVAEELVQQCMVELTHTYKGVLCRTPPLVLVEFLSKYGTDTFMLEKLFEMCATLLTYSDEPFKADVACLSWYDSKFEGAKLFTSIVKSLIKVTKKLGINSPVKQCSNLTISEVFTKLEELKSNKLKEEIFKCLLAEPVGDLHPYDKMAIARFCLKFAFDSSAYTQAYQKRKVLEMTAAMDYGNHRLIDSVKEILTGKEIIEYLKYYKKIFNEETWSVQCQVLSVESLLYEAVSKQDRHDASFLETLIDDLEIRPNELVAPELPQKILSNEENYDTSALLWMCKYFYENDEWSNGVQFAIAAFERVLKDGYLNQQEDILSHMEWVLLNLTDEHLRVVLSSVTEVQRLLTKVVTAHANYSHYNYRYVYRYTCDSELEEVHNFLSKLYNRLPVLQELLQIDSLVMGCFSESLCRMVKYCQPKRNVYRSVVRAMRSAILLCQERGIANSKIDEFVGTPVSCAVPSSRRSLQNLVDEAVDALQS
ncbi:uncharacterized protein [Ptychodera flava]|uniref:uncharacterized protein n=1 Tax=Ptychodera flava TaxID=63121 RepID=UPI00396A7761